MIVEFIELIRKARTKTTDVDKLSELGDTLAYINRVHNGLIKPKQGRYLEKEVRVSNNHTITITLNLD